MNMIKIARAVMLLISVQSFVVASLYASQHNWKLALYWAFVGGINAVCSTF